MSPGAIEAYLESGRFPDGTVLVKEVLGTSTSGMTTGTVSHASTLKGWFVIFGAMDGRAVVRRRLRTALPRT